MHTLPGFFFCICPDAGLIKACIDERFNPNTECRTSVFWADEGLDQKFWNALGLVSMDNRTQLLIVRSAHLLSAATWKALSSSLSVPHAGVLPVLCLECPWEKNKPKLPAAVAKLKCLSCAYEKQWVWSSPGLDKRSLKNFVQQELRRRGLRAENSMAAYLAEITLPDATAVKNLLDQLALASAEDGVLSWDMLRQMAACTPEAVIFDLVRCLEQGNAAGAWKMLKSSGDGGESFLFPLLSLMAREARTLWQICAGEQVYLPGFLESEKKSLARRLGFEGVAAIFEAIAHTENAVKSGERQPLPALEGLLASLVKLFQKPQNAER